MSVSSAWVAERYRLIAPLGAGGMGRVWLARDEMLRRDVAIKEVVPPHGLTEAESEELRLRTIREARAAARLNDPHVVRIYDVIYTEQRPWIVMEYVPSRSLHQVITEDGPLPPNRAAEIGLAVLGALQAAHSAGVLHRDVKPGNVLLADTGRVVLTDFGLAIFEGGDGTVTRSGLILGSPQYIAPERAREGISGPEADLWSLGATLYAAVEGQSPYARSTTFATLTALATEDPDPPRRAGPLKPVLNALLRKDPRARANIAEAERLLRRAATGEGRVWPWSLPRQRRPRDAAAGRPPASASPAKAAAGAAAPAKAAPAKAAPAKAAPAKAAPGKVAPATAGPSKAVPAAAPAAASPATAAPAAASPATAAPATAGSVKDAPSPATVRPVTTSAPPAPVSAQPAPTPTALASAAGASGSAAAAARAVKASPVEVATPDASPEPTPTPAADPAPVEASEPAAPDLAESAAPAEAEPEPETAPEPAEAPLSTTELETATAVDSEASPASAAETTDEEDEEAEEEAQEEAPPAKGLDATLVEADTPSSEAPTRADAVSEIGSVATTRVKFPGKARGSARVPARTRPGVDAPPGTRPDHRWRWVVGVAAAVVMVVIVALVANGTRKDANTGTNNGAPATSSSAAAAAPLPSPSAAVSPSAAASPSATPGGPSGSTGPNGFALPPGFHWYTDPQYKWSIAVPDGWTQSRDPGYPSMLYFNEPTTPKRRLGVDRSDKPKPDPVADWTNLERGRINDLPGYHREKIEPVNYFRAAADWIYTYNGSSGRLEVCNRGFVVNDHLAHAIFWLTPASQWDENQSNWNVIVASFEPGI